MNKLVAVLLISSLALSANAEDQALPINVNGPYSIIVIPSPAKETIYGVKCNNGTSSCMYDWRNLCKTGTAKNTTPIGGIEETPGFSRAPDGTPVRLFICV